MTISSYPSVYAIGHKAIEGIFNDEVLIEEKIDGSQFSMGVINGSLNCRSKGKELFTEGCEKMFDCAMDTANNLKNKMHRGWTYRCEYLRKPKHNCLCYQRVPKQNLIVFDIQVGMEDYLSYEDKKQEAERLGLECVQILYQGKVEGVDQLIALLETDSVLGNSKIEGVVVKNYTLFTREKKVAIGKYVSEKFKEKHGSMPFKTTRKGTVQQIIDIYRTDARWEKAIQHLRDDGLLDNEPKDIGKLIKEIGEDTLKEYQDEIKERLFKEYWGHIRRGITAGFPEWYKERLMKGAFGDND